MKKFRRLAALLVAGVMALMLFAGCSGSGVNTAVENELLKQFNKLAGTEFQNDSKLHATAMQMLEKIDPESGLIRKDDYIKFIAQYENGERNEAMFMVVVRKDAEGDEADYGDYYIARELTPEMQKNLNLKDFLGEMAITPDVAEAVKGVAFAARTINGRTYLAVGVSGEGLAE